MQETIIDLIRHGEPVGGSRYRGNRIDDPLSEKGWSQMWAAVENAPAWQQIITSPLQRCRAFADALAEKQDIPVQVDERLREIGFGDWEGQTRQQIQANNQAEYDDFYRDPINNRPDGAEPLDIFMERTRHALEDIVRHYEGSHLLIVAHAGVIRALITYAIGAEANTMYRINIGNAGMTQITHDQNGARLQFHNLQTCYSSPK